jgi:hypothetical protein
MSGLLMRACDRWQAAEEVEHLGAAQRAPDQNDAFPVDAVNLEH